MIYKTLKIQDKTFDVQYLHLLHNYNIVQMYALLGPLFFDHGL